MLSEINVIKPIIQRWKHNGDAYKIPPGEQ